MMILFVLSGRLPLFKSISLPSYQPFSAEQGVIPIGYFFGCGTASLPLKIRIPPSGDENPKMFF